MHRPILSDLPDRRTIGRMPLRRAARLVLRDHTRVDCRTIDVSATGVGALIDRSLPTGELCAIGFSLSLADGSVYQVQAAAHIAYCIYSSDRQGFKVGLRFHQAPTSLTQSVARYVAEAAPVFRDV